MKTLHLMMFQQMMKVYDGTIKSNYEQMTTLSNKNEKYVN